MPISRLLETHFRQILRLEDSAVKDLSRVYRDTKLELVERLHALDSQGAGSTFTAQHLALVLAQVDSALKVMWQAHGRSLGEAFREALGLGGSQELAEIVDLEHRFGIAELATRIANILPVIPVHTVTTLAKPLNLLLSRFKDGVHAQVARGLAASVAMGESISKTARRLGKTMDGESYQLERIARTEINHAANYGHFDTVQSVGDKFPEMGLQKQWSAHLDSRTSARCRGLHLQVKPTKEEFVARDGWRGLYPPSHPCCRSRVMPWCARWESTSVKKIDDEAAGTAANPLEQSNPTQADRKSAARSNERRGFTPTPAEP
jgi:SPP1 gp7 family putative phage head morphogenesis protein